MFDNSDIIWIVINNWFVLFVIVLCLYLFVVIFVIIWGFVLWIYLVEIFLFKICVKVVLFLILVNWFWNMVFVFVVLLLLWNIFYKMYYIFVVFNGVVFIYMVLMVLEMKGFILEEMDEVFDLGRLVWKKFDRGSRLEELEREIERGNVKVLVFVGG